jgi:signal transduction histidine kinase
MPVTPGPGDDLWTALLRQLAPSAGESPSSTEARSVLQACAAEVQRFAERERETQAQEALHRLAALLAEVSMSMERSERRWSRLGFDLHDSALQEVAALRMLVRALPPESLPKRLDDLLEQIDEGLGSLDRGLRELVETFETPDLAERPLEESVRTYVQAFESSAGLSVSVDVRGDFEILSRSQRIALVRILSEALTNVRKHSGASRVWVTMSVSGRWARLRVRDDGRGFDPDRRPGLAASTGRRGLIGMGERARLLGGRWEVSTRPGGPTTIAVVIPAGHVEELPRAVESPAGDPQST